MDLDWEIPRLPCRKENFENNDKVFNILAHNSNSILKLRCSNKQPCPLITCPLMCSKHLTPNCIFLYLRYHFTQHLTVAKWFLGWIKWLLGDLHIYINFILTTNLSTGVVTPVLQVSQLKFRVTCPTVYYTAKLGLKSMTDSKAQSLNWVILLSNLLHTQLFNI